MNTRYNIFQKLLAGLLSLVMVLGLVPAIAITADAVAPVGYVSGSKKADPATIDWEDYFGPGKMDTELAGAVWTDKSVFGAATDELPGISLKNPDNFLIALSAIASNMAVTGHTASPTDTMLVLDLSGSMVNGTYTVGTVLQGNNYRQVRGINTDIIEALVDSTNAVIKSLMEQNTNNRVGVVLYSGNTDTDDDATPNSATVVLPLGRYKHVNGEYLSLDADFTTATLYEWVQSGWNGSYQEVGETTYVPENTDIKVAVKAGLQTEGNTAVAPQSKTVVGGTYIQNGLYKAMQEFLEVEDTIVPEGKVQAGAERTPVLVLMTDGAPTIATTNYDAVGNSNTGNGSSSERDNTAPLNHITFLTQLTAAYVRGVITEHYAESATDDQKALFLTLGLGTSNNTNATSTLYPAGNSSTLTGYWNRYLATQNGRTVDVDSGTGRLEVERSDMVAAMNYVDKYYYASDAESLINSFKEIASEIELQSAFYATLVEGGNADLSGYVTFEDELGELMQVQDMKGILLDNSYFSGKEIAEGMNKGVLGTPDGATELGDELIRTVKERIPGTTTTQAQQLVNQAYLDDQLHYTDDNNWSNYIGWYADENGNYVGFWDKDSGYENAPANAVYANKSYGYLGANGNSDMMHVVVMVRTNLKTLHQTVFFKVPAALLPTVSYKVTLDESDPSKVESFVREGAEPIQLVFEVGLRSDINAVNLEDKIAAHIAKGGHVHRNADGSVDLYTNSWAIGNDKNQNGIPDPDEVADAVVAQAHFHPSLENSRYYFTQDTLVLDANGNPVTGDTQPSGTGYHHDYHIYDEDGRTTVERALSEITLSKTQQNADGQWYVPAGTAYRELPRFRNYKSQNLTGTLDYSDYPAVFADDNIDVYSFLGNNGTVRIAPASGFALTKQVEGTIAGVSAYTFEVTLSNIPAGTTAAPVLTDANGDDLTGVTMSDYENGKFTVTLPVGVTAYISGIPAGTQVAIVEKIEGDYKVTGVTVNGAAQTGSAQFTVPAYAADPDSSVPNVEQMVPVSFTNAPNSYGDLVIEKEVTHDLAADPAALAGKVFTFRVKLTGDKIAAGQTYATSADQDVKVGADGYLTFADGTAITLHNDESITIYDIPEFTTYTVTEEDIPGFQLESINGEAVTQASGVISANTEKQADFVNRYPDEFTSVEVPLTLDVTKVLTEITPYTGSEEFVFVLQMLLPDGTYPDIPADNGENYLKVAKNSTEQGAWTLTFDTLGTYFFRVVELKPSQQTPAGTDTPGMDYSTQRSLFQVNVTDEDMDGILEVAVTEEANVNVSAGYANSDEERITGIDVAATFTNVYELGSTSTSLNVHKDLNNETGVNKALTAFRFALYPSDAEGNVAEGAQGTTVTTSALGDATFNIFLDTPGTFYYKVVEQIPAAATLDAASGKYVLNGMYYDATAYLFTVVTEANPQGDLVVTSRTLTNLVTDADVADLTATFENDYILGSVDVNIPVRKTFSGRALADGETFQFRLERTNAAYVPLTGNDAYAATKETATTALFGLTYDKVGIYHYRLVETIPAGAQNNVFDGVRYDTAVYHIIVTVTDKGDGTLEASRQIYKVGQSNALTEALFTNVYQVTGSGSVTIGGKKVLEGRMLYNGEFEFGLYDNAACEGEPIATAKNLPNGDFSFPEITYTVEDLGENNAAKTYTYYVKEIKGALGGVTYNETVQTVTVTVSHDKGVLVVTPSANYNTLEIVNTYVADGIDVVLSGAKVLSGDWTNVPAANKQFTFELYQTGADFLVTGEPIGAETVTGSGDFSFTRHFDDGDEGFYYFVMKEDTSLAAGGIGYDAGEYHITVNIFDPGAGALASQVTMYRPGTGNTTSAVFTNVYAVTPIELVLEGDKSFVDVSTDQPKAMTEGQFQFVVLEDTRVVATGINLADGTIQFSPIRYTQAGEHTYTVIETPGTAGGVTYDDTVFTVTVSVVDNGDGTLTATPNDSDTPIVFENTYDPGQTSITLEGSKELTGRDQVAEEFIFEVYEGEELVSTGKNAADGNIAFTPIEYTTAGEYTYTVIEKNTGKDGITYDETVFTVTVTVTDNGDGTLTAEADYAGKEVIFRNTYVAKDVNITLKAEKTLTGRDLENGEFTFQILSGGNVVSTGKNDANGAVTFQSLGFDKAGEYTFTVKEVKGDVTYVIYDDAVYTFTVKVTDGGNGQLTAKVYSGETEITDGVVANFENEFAPPSTPVTGDTSNLPLMVTITALSGAAILFLAVLVIAEDKKKKASAN